MRAATNDFSPINKIGEGGFGSVYKVMEHAHFSIWVLSYLFVDFFWRLMPSVVIFALQGKLKNGKMAAIKVLSTESTQGVKEFLTEIQVISEIEHENLVKLYGCCAEGNHRILVYNYLENNSLAQTLLGTVIIMFLFCLTIIPIWTQVCLLEFFIILCEYFYKCENCFF